jgi:hypothetical protein
MEDDDVYQLMLGDDVPGRKAKADLVLVVGDRVERQRGYQVLEGVVVGTEADDHYLVDWGGWTQVVEREQLQFVPSQERIAALTAIFRRRHQENPGYEIDVKRDVAAYVKCTTRRKKKRGGTE